MLTYQSFELEQEGQILMGIRDGMQIYDIDSNKVGAVSYVHFPAESEAVAMAEEAAYLSPIPRDMRARLLREGFVQVDSGLFVSDGYITPRQILEVTDQYIKLRVQKDALI